MTESTDPLIRAAGLTLAHGATVAVRGLDLEVVPGHLVVLIGGDGAGKSTTLRALAGRLLPAAGTVTRRPGLSVGVVPERGAVFTDLTVTENLSFAAAVHGAGPVQVALLDRVGLREARARLAGDLSGGMRQKLAIAMALQHHPDLLLLDEPTSGVDPVSRADLWRLLAEELAAGTGVVLATTYLDEAARASEVIVLDGGHVLRRGTPAGIRATTPGRVVRHTAAIGPHAWRRGRAWHSWIPEGGASPEGVGDVVGPDLEDAVIVAAMEAADSPSGSGSQR